MTYILWKKRNVKGYQEKTLGNVTYYKKSKVIQTFVHAALFLSLEMVLGLAMPTRFSKQNNLFFCFKSDKQETQVWKAVVY